jgi:hypothetical protein
MRRLILAAAVMSLRVESSYAQAVEGPIQIPGVDVTAPAPATLTLAMLRPDTGWLMPPSRSFTRIKRISVRSATSRF